MLPTAALCLSLVLMVKPSMSQQPLTSGDPQQKSFSSLTHPSWSLGLQVYRALRNEGSHINTLISPVLLANALDALSHTAKGATARQLQELLKNYKDVKFSPNPFKSMRNANGTSYILHGSSAIFSKQVTTLESGFLEELQTQFELDHVALGLGDKQEDMEKLRSWAKSGMGGVKEMPLIEGPDSKEGALILASALHFKGEKVKDLSRTYFPLKKKNLNDFVQNGTRCNTAHAKSFPKSKISCSM